jgi:outer membrane protein assembly factor BamB
LDVATGRLLWRRELQGLGAASAYFAQGKLFVKSASTIHALEAESGNEIWRFCPYGKEGEWIYSNPVVYRGRLYVGDRCGVLHCLDANSGKPRWAVKTNRAKRNGDVNSTPVVVHGLVVVGTNAKTALAFDWRTGRLAWRQRLDGPAATGFFVHQGLVVAVTDTVYLMCPESGRIRLHLRWRDDVVAYATDLGAQFAVLMRGSSPSQNTGNLYICDVSEGVVAQTTHNVWCPSLRYIPATRLAYLSHLRGVRLLDEHGSDLLNLMASGTGVGLVDVKDEIIYAMTNRGFVYALRHPTVRTPLKGIRTS